MISFNSLQATGRSLSYSDQRFQSVEDRRISQKLLCLLILVLIANLAVAQDFYWIGNGGDWKDPAHWSLTSGGISAGSIPTASDNVHFDSQSFTNTDQVVVIEDDGTMIGVSFKDMDWRGVTNHPTFQIKAVTSDWVGNSCYGSIYFDYNMTLDFLAAEFYMHSTSDYFLDTKNLDMGQNCWIQFNAAQPVNATLLSSIKGGWLFVQQGFLAFNGYSFVGQNDTYPALWLNGSLSTPVTVDATGSFIDVGSILITSYSTLIDDFASIFVRNKFDASNQDLNNVTFFTVNMTATSSNNTFRRLNLTAGEQVLLAAGQTQYVDELNLNGTSSKPILLHSTTDGTVATISKSSGKVNGTFLQLKDITVTGGATFVANYSTDEGNNSGWTFKDDEVLAADALALTELYQSMGGTNWTNQTGWLVEPVQTWYGVVANEGRVVGLNLSGNNLTGTIPDEVGDLTSLTSLNLSLNKLTGSIPASIGNLTELTSLNLQSNFLESALPVELFDLTMLKTLYLGLNGLYGSLSPAIGNLTNLVSFSIGDNRFTGSIPDEIGNLNQLYSLDLSYNLFEGNIPYTFNSLSSLKHLNVQLNELTYLPDLSGLNLISLRLNYNRFTYGGLEPNYQKYSGYSAQKEIGVQRVVKLSNGQSETFEIDVDGSANSYQWYKDDLPIGGATANSYTINSFTTADKGRYILKITNSILPQEILYSAAIFVQASNESSTNNYQLNTVAYSHSNLSSPVSLSLADDQLSTAVPIGFNFKFYGTFYSQLYVSSNGFVTFLPNQGEYAWSGEDIPFYGFKSDVGPNYSANGLIAGYWTDIDPNTQGGVSYQTIGSAPNRIFVVDYSGVPACCRIGAPSVTMQIKLFESSNNIEIHCANCNYLNNWVTQGIENKDGSEAVYKPGRTHGFFSLSNDGIQFKPSATQGKPNNSPLTLLSSNQIKSQDADSEVGISDVTLDATGAMVMVGEFAGTVDFDPGPGQHLFTAPAENEESYVAKYNSDGSIAWAYMLINAGGQNYISYDALATDAGNAIYLAGNLRGTADVDPGSGVVQLTSSGGVDVNEPVFSKVSATGDLIWAKQLSFSGSGFGYYSSIESITIDNNNDILVMGKFDAGNLDVDPGGGVTELSNTGVDYIDNIFIAKYDNNGNYLWSVKRVYEESNDFDVYSTVLVTDSQNNVYLSYSVYDYLNDDYLVVEKFSSTGTLLWSITNQQANGEFHPLKLDESNNKLYVVGDSEGTPVFNGTSGSGTLPPSSQNGSVGFIAIYDLNGGFISSIGLTSSGSLFPVSLNILNDGNLLLSGFYSKSIDMDPSAETFEQFNSQASFITEITPSGNFIWGASISNSGVSENSGGLLTYLNPQGELVGLLLFDGVADVDPGVGTTNLTTLGNDMAILKYTLQSVGITAADRSALEALFNSTGGPNWIVNSNWLSGNPSSWFGITVTGDKVTAINLPANNLTGTVPDDIIGLDDLTAIDISGNKLISLPDLSAIPGITSLNVSNNKLDFSSLQPNVTINGINYIPQDSVETKDSALKQINEQINFTASIGGTGNIYQWKKNGIDIARANQSTLTLAGIAFKDEGDYNYNATNPAVPGLTLFSRAKTLRVSSLERDSLALRLLYNSTNGPGWTNHDNWLTTPLGTGNWYGVTIGNNRVTELNLSNNNLSGSVPKELADIQNLSLLNLSSNKIEHLPDLKPLGNIAVLDVSKNQLDFASLIANSAIVGVNYLNQADIGVASTELVDYGTNYPLKVSSKGEGNRYQWKRNGVDVAGATDSTYTITAINRANMGEYVSVITNPAVPDLTIKTAPKKVLATAVLSGKFSLADGSGVSKGKIRLLLVKPSNGYDTVAVKDLNQDGSFRFEKVILDNYQISGFADTLTYSGALPTYYKSTVYWEEGDTLFLDGNRDDLNFESVFKPTEVPKGVGVISGIFYESTIGQGRIERPGRVNGAGASVRSVQNTAKPLGEKLTLVAYVFTNEDGAFELPELPEGDYRLNIQYPGYPMDQTSFINITIRSGLKSQVQVAANIEDNKIKVTKLVITELFEKTGINVQVYPNPSADHVIVGFPDTSPTRSMELVNVLSEKVASQAASQKENKLHVGQFPPGMYFLQIKEKGEIVKTVRIAKE